MDGQNIPTMNGKTSTYARVCQRGEIGIGIQYHSVISGQSVGADGISVLRFRVQSRAIGAHGSDDGKVVPLVPNYTATSAWPQITFESVTEDRACTLLHAVVEGDVASDPEGVWQSAYANDSVGQALHRLVDACNETSADIVADHNDVADYLEAQVKEDIKQITKAKQMRDALHQNLHANTGAAVFSAEISPNELDPSTEGEAQPTAGNVTKLFE